MGEFVDVGERPAADVFGHEELAASTAEFQEQWRVGVSELVGDTSVIHQRLVDTVDEYRRVDEGAAALFRGVFGEG
jgi:hypothetical protein